KYRMPLSIKDIKYEYSRRFFLDNLAIFIRVDNKIVGYGQILFLEGKYTIANLGILTEYQGKGYGKLLIKKLLNLAKEENISQLYIKVKESNKIAMKLYKGIGFEEVEKVHIYTIA
ncbi:GNAT family N-acetyltransferase, partial [Clostridium tarantellae]